MDTQHDVSILLKNITLEYLNSIANEEKIQQLCGSKFYMFGTYDKVEFCGEEFMVLKSTKKAVILLNISF
jgi:hypothetical protein